MIICGIRETPEPTPKYLFWLPRWRRKVRVYGDLRLIIGEWDWAYSNEADAS